MSLPVVQRKSCLTAGFLALYNPSQGFLLVDFQLTGVTGLALGAFDVESYDSPGGSVATVAFVLGNPWNTSQRNRLLEGSSQIGIRRAAVPGIPTLSTVRFMRLVSRPIFWAPSAWLLGKVRTDRSLLPARQWT